MLFRIYLLSFLLEFTLSTVNKNLKISCGLDEVTRDSVAMRFFVRLHNTGKDCQVECIPEKCCLEQEKEEDCDSLQIIGGCFLNVPAGESRTVRLAAPLLNPFDRRGYCVLHLYSKPEGHTIFWDTVTIPFDTGGEADVKPCARLDHDPLNSCRPVDCDTHYNGQKPHFNRTLRRCQKTPSCPENLMYDPRINECVEQVTRRDIRHIKSKIKRKRRRKDTSKKKTSPKAKANDANGKTEKAEKALSKSAQKAKDTKTPSRLFVCNSVGALTLIICAQCCAVGALVFWVRKRCKSAHKEKEVVSKFINTRDSITTPLLSTNCTLTTCQYLSESSTNIDRKIKNYKESHKDQAKISMSDDILARCVKRRDWTRPKSTEVIPETKETENVEAVNFVDTAKSVYKIDKANFPKSAVEIQSEEEVKCLDYEDRKQDLIIKLPHVPAYESITGKGTQANLSRDSIDHFLSEHGMDYLGRPYTFSDASNISSGASSKNVNVLSVHRLGPSSDPGGGASDDLELLHMSRVSMFSSSNASLHTAMKRTRESRSSM